MTLCFFGFNGFNAVPLVSSIIPGVDAIERPPHSNDNNFALSWSTFVGLTGDGHLRASRTVSPEGSPWTTDQYKKVACSDGHVAAVSADDGHGVLVRLHPDTQLREVSELHDQLGSHQFVDCDVGDSDAVYLSSNGRVVWVDLRCPILETQILPLAFKIIEVCCGGKEHVVLLNDLGTVYTFGMGSRGQLGHGDLEHEPSPRPVEHLEGIRVRHIAAGGWHSAAVTYDGDLYTWGWNESGQLGFPTPSTSQVAFDATSNSVTVQATPRAVDFPDDVLVASVSCGSRHTLILTEEGRVYAFGWNANGQLGVPTRPVISVPTKLTQFDGMHVSAVRCQGWSSVVVVDPP